MVQYFHPNALLRSSMTVVLTLVLPLINTLPRPPYKRCVPVTWRYTGSSPKQAPTPFTSPSSSRSTSSTQKGRYTQNHNISHCLQTPPLHLTTQTSRHTNTHRSPSSHTPRPASSTLPSTALARSTAPPCAPRG